VAQTVHELSPRTAFQFVAINCAAIPETLLESEIFGHEKGAFTGAIDRRLGCFELAHRGTLFLDEIAEMTPSTQVKLLRVLQERTFRRLGGRHEQHVDVRVVAATNMNPIDAVERGKLREDLYYRLNVFALEIPPLRERREDIPLLVQAFLQEFNVRNGRQVKSVTPTWCVCSSATRGRATSANCATSWSARRSWPRASSSPPSTCRRTSRVWPGRSRRPPCPHDRPGGRAAARGRVGDLRAGHDGRGGRDPADRTDAAAHAEQQDTGGRDPRISLKTLHNKLNRLKAMGTPIEPR